MSCCKWSLQQLTNLTPFQCHCHFWVFSWTPNRGQACRAGGVACAGALRRLGVPWLQLSPGFPLPWHSTLLQPGWWRCVSFVSLRPLSSQVFASHIANTCIFLFVYFRDGNAYACVSSRRVEFSRIGASVIESFLFATAICSVFLRFHEDWFGFLESSCWCFSYHFLSMAANACGHPHISWVFIHLIFIKSSQTIFFYCYNRTHKYIRSWWSTHMLFKRWLDFITPPPNIFQINIFGPSDHSEVLLTLKCKWDSAAFLTGEQVNKKRVIYSCGASLKGNAGGCF